MALSVRLGVGYVHSSLEPTNRVEANSVKEQGIYDT